ncbi:hypothetical protein Rs2_18639 [Raphanus sativus]|nr:hypothetical protein Rs2_18639 [Raphanus sativus]
MQISLRFRLSWRNLVRQQRKFRVPFVLILNDNIMTANEEFCEFIYTRFHGEFPEMGRIIEVVNAICARVGPRIFVHNIGECAYLMRVTNAKTRNPCSQKPAGMLLSILCLCTTVSRLHSIKGSYHKCGGSYGTQECPLSSLQ